MSQSLPSRRSVHTFAFCVTMTDKRLVFVGTIASSVSLKELDVFEGFLSVENGKVSKF